MTAVGGALRGILLSGRKFVKSTTASEFSPEVAMRAYPAYPVLLARAQALEMSAILSVSQSRLVMKKKSQAFENKTLVEGGEGSIVMLRSKFIRLIHTPVIHEL
jgi:hypothetical protein